MNYLNRDKISDLNRIDLNRPTLLWTGGFDPSNLSVEDRGPVWHNVTWDHTNVPRNGISFHPTALAECMSVTDDIQMDNRQTDHTMVTRVAIGIIAFSNAT